MREWVKLKGFQPETYMQGDGIESTDHELSQLTAMFRLLSDKTRLNILLMLADGERNVTSLCDQLKLPQPTVSHHLGLLRMNNVIGNRRAGKQVFYGLNGAVNAVDASVSIQVQSFDVRISRKNGEISSTAHVPSQSGREIAGPSVG